jgi:hypothetical protein
MAIRFIGGSDQARQLTHGLTAIPGVLGGSSVGVRSSFLVLRSSLLALLASLAVHSIPDWRLPIACFVAVFVASPSIRSSWRSWRFNSPVRPRAICVICAICGYPLRLRFVLSCFRGSLSPSVPLGGLPFGFRHSPFRLSTSQLGGVGVVVALRHSHFPLRTSAVLPRVVDCLSHRYLSFLSSRSHLSSFPEQHLNGKPDKRHAPGHQTAEQLIDFYLVFGAFSASGMQIVCQTYRIA